MRGKLPASAVPVFARRIIPAHAGQTVRLLFCLVFGADHPRACGANRVPSINGAFSVGSSPRMRGKPADITLVQFDVRIIPAHAGQTPSAASWRIRSPDHPRACGANRLSHIDCQSRCGSSPRMRGKRFLSPHLRTYTRIIPAHAGQTRTGATRALAPPDHPRACGANFVAVE